MEKEIELKLRVAPDDMSVLRNHPQFVEAFHSPAHATLNSVYFDSDDRSLREHGLTLRVRQIGTERVQTVKSVSHGSDWFERSEWEQTIEGDQPDLTSLTDTALGPILTDSVRNALKPVFETRIERTTYKRNENGTNIVVAVDEGQIIANDLSCPVSEIELELKQGATAELFEIARAINDIVPAQLDVKSKSERGYDLIDKRLVAVEKADNPIISEGMGAGRAFTIIGRACLRHLVANTAATLDRDTEALHQMRVALRRLRASISLFSDFLDDDKIVTIRTEMKWLAHEFGPARNLDTHIFEVLKPLRQQYPKEPGLASIGKMFARQRLKYYRGVRQAVQSTRSRNGGVDRGRPLDSFGRPPEESATSSTNRTLCCRAVFAAHSVSRWGSSRRGAAAR
jgi:inorganic triphosphatase YgiF